MNDKIIARISRLLGQYMRYMSKEAAVAKVKRSHLNRLDQMIDSVAAKLATEPK